MNDQPTIGTLFDLDEARARRNDPETSHEAADGNDVASSVDLVLRTLRKFGPMHDEKLVTIIRSASAFQNPDDPTAIPNYAESRIRTARNTLVKRSLVRFTGDYTVTTRGARTRIWAVAA